MAWTNTVANKVTLGYLHLKCNVPVPILQEDPKVSELPFFNADATPDANANEINIFVGEFITYLVAMQYALEAGKTNSSAYNDVYAVCINGNKNASDIGNAVNVNYKFADEVSNP